MLNDHALQALAARLTAVAGIVGVTLGGSRARGTHTAASDYDLGLYYRPPLNVRQLNELAQDVAGPATRATSPGEWGPWVDGGAWLTIDDTPVDWIYRDIDRVHTSWTAAQGGHFQFHAQVGHPLGVPDFAYAGEVALAVILADPTGELTALQQATRNYPAALQRALVAGLWEASFVIENARKAVTRTDTAYITGCLFRVVGLCAHALHGHAGSWLISEKGAVQSVQELPNAPADFVHTAHRLLGRIGTTELQLEAALVEATDLLAATTKACDTPQVDTGL